MEGFEVVELVEIYVKLEEIEVDKVFVRVLVIFVGFGFIFKM